MVENYIGNRGKKTFKVQAELTKALRRPKHNNPASTWSEVIMTPDQWARLFIDMDFKLRVPTHHAIGDPETFEKFYQDGENPDGVD